MQPAWLLSGVVLLLSLTNQACDASSKHDVSQADKRADGGSDIVEDAGSGGEDLVDSAAPHETSLARVSEIFSAHCLPCHATTPERPNAAGKLDLGSADAVYEQLVGVAAQGGPCASSAEMRVVAGDSTASLLMDKLLNTPNMCGAPMPKPGSGQEFMQLSDEDIATIAAWIDEGASAD